jgi:hypothetical protein
MHFSAREIIDVCLSRNHVVFHMCSSVCDSIGFIKSKWKSTFCKQKISINCHFSVGDSGIWEHNTLFSCRDSGTFPMGGCRGLGDRFPASTMACRIEGANHRRRFLWLGVMISGAKVREIEQVLGGEKIPFDAGDAE